MASLTLWHVFGLELDRAQAVDPLERVPFISLFVPRAKRRGTAGGIRLGFGIGRWAKGGPLGSFGVHVGVWPKSFWRRLAKSAPLPSGHKTPAQTRDSSWLLVWVWISALGRLGASLSKI